MTKNQLLVFLLSQMIPGSIFADWVPVKGKRSFNSRAKDLILRDDQNSSVFKIDLSDITVSEYLRLGENLQSVNLLVDRFSSGPGSIQLPRIDGTISGGKIFKQKRPKPMSSDTWINFSLYGWIGSAFQIQYIKGQLVPTIFNKNQSIGIHSFMWNRLHVDGNQLEPGIYFYRIETDDYIET